MEIVDASHTTGVQLQNLMNRVSSDLPMGNREPVTEEPVTEELGVFDDHGMQIH